MEEAALCLSVDVEPLSPVVHSGGGVGLWQPVGGWAWRCNGSTGLASFHFPTCRMETLEHGVVAGVAEQSQGEPFPHNTVQKVWFLCSAMGCITTGEALESVP